VDGLVWLYARGDLQVFVEEGRSSCLSEGFIWLQLRGPHGRRILQ